MLPECSKLTLTQNTLQVYFTQVNGPEPNSEASVSIKDPVTNEVVKLGWMTGSAYAREKMVDAYHSPSVTHQMVPLRYASAHGHQSDMVDYEQYPPV